MPALPSGVQKKFIGAVQDEWQLYSDNFADYTLGLPIGFGASSIVYAALYHPPPPAAAIPCALKVLDLDSLPPNSLRLLQRETTLMSLSKHPNVLRVRGTWMDGHKLYIAMRLMNKGSAADVMRYGWPGGMEEEVVRCILKQALGGLNYLHINGFIHRDVKAANLLIDDDGTVLLGDLGVAASLADDIDPISPVPKSSPVHNTPAAQPKRVVNFTVPDVRPKMGKRKSFVGTPCWMSPELIQGHHYDSSSDIWSFGITALELSQGRPPRSRESPSKVLVKTVQNAPPVLDRHSGQFKYSRAFQEIVETCLVKDPSKRPTAEELLQTPFFRSAKKKSYLIGAILSNLPPLASRQERRRQPSFPAHRTIDSWDFTYTPQVSIMGRPVPSLSSSGKSTDSLTASLFMRSTSLVEEGVSEEDVGEEFTEEPIGEGEAQVIEELETTSGSLSPGTSPGTSLGSSTSISERRVEGHKKIPTKQVPPTSISKSIPDALPPPPALQRPSKPVPMTKPHNTPSRTQSSAPLLASFSPQENGLWRKIMRGEGNSPSTSTGDERESEKDERKRKSAIGNMFMKGKESVRGIVKTY